MALGAIDSSAKNRNALPRCNAFFFLLLLLLLILILILILLHYLDLYGVRVCIRTIVCLGVLLYTVESSRVESSM